MLLARAGARVTVLEKQDRVGGRTSSLGGNGFTFDLGPTFFLYPRVLEGIFHSVGRNLREEVPMTRLDPQYHLIFEPAASCPAPPTSPVWWRKSLAYVPQTPPTSHASLTTIEIS